MSLQVLRLMILLHRRIVFIYVPKAINGFPRLRNSYTYIRYNIRFWSAPVTKLLYYNTIRTMRPIWKLSGKPIPSYKIFCNSEIPTRKVLNPTSLMQYVCIYA